MVTTARRDLRSYAFALLTSYRAADTSRVQEVFARRPSHFNRPMPFGYVDILSETATHSAGIRTRTLSPSFVFVFDPDLETDDLDVVVDTFSDHLTDSPHIVPNTVWSTWVMTEESEEVESPTGVKTFPAVRFSVPDHSVSEGRD
jgi:hypothetical protein